MRIDTHEAWRVRVCATTKRLSHSAPACSRFVSQRLILIGLLVFSFFCPSSFQAMEDQYQRREAAWTFGWHLLKREEDKQTDRQTNRVGWGGEFSGAEQETGSLASCELLDLLHSVQKQCESLVDNRLWLYLNRYLHVCWVSPDAVTSCRNPEMFAFTTNWALQLN